MSSPKLFGRKARAEKAGKTAAAARHHVTELMERIRFEYWSDGIDEARFDEASDWAQAEIKRHATSPEVYRLRLLALIEELGKVVKQHQLKVSLPSPPVKIVRETGFRTKAWFARARDVWPWEERFEECLQDLSTPKSFDVDRLLGAILYSAMTRGGLLDPKMVEALGWDLREAQESLFISGELCWIELTVLAETGPHNVRSADGKKPRRMRRWFPDLLSLGLIERYRRLRKPAANVFFQSLTYRTLVHAIWQDTPVEGTLTNINSLASAAIWVTETKLNVRLSQAVIEMAMFRQPSFSADAVSWRVHLGCHGNQSEAALKSYKSGQTQNWGPQTKLCRVGETLRDFEAAF